MKYFYSRIIILLLLLCSLSLTAQISFVEDTTVPFDDVTLGDIAFADVDNDGDQDVLFTGLNGGSTVIAKLYLNDGTGNFSEVMGTPFIGVFMSSISFADIDNDGDQDVVITGKLFSNFASTELYTNDGAGNFTLVIGDPFEDVQFGRSAFADVDNDNDLDLIITGSSDLAAINNLYINDGSGVFTLSVQPFIAVGGYSDVAFADIDGDNDLDVLMSGQGSTIGETYLYINDGSGNYTLVPGTPFIGVQNAAIGFADIDNDGDQDVLITGSPGSTRRSYLYENDGFGNFILAANQPLTGVSAGDVEFADVNADGNIDLMITGAGGGAILYSNDCYGNFAEVTGMPFAAVSNSAIAFADVDGDGDLDLLTTGAGGGTSLYINESLPETSTVGAFITTWETTTANESITIPTTGVGYNYNVDWGDGNTTTGATGDASHIYTSVGTYQVTITGTFPRIYFNGSTSASKIKSIDQWGCNPWESMRDAFKGCANVIVNATDIPNLNNVTSMREMFSGATSLGGGTGNWDWSTGNVTTMESLFFEATNFNKDISTWDMSSVTTTNTMFCNASTFNQNIGNWDVSNVLLMSGMFCNASTFNQNIDNWNVSNVTRMNTMFKGASSFNGVIGGWDTGNVTDMISMFGDATAFNQDIGAWNTINVTSMNSMFLRATAFNQNIGNWNVSNVLYTSGMFQGATVFNQDIGAWNTSSVTAMTGMFNGASAFNQDIGNWDTSNVWTFTLMFMDAVSFDQDLGNWNVSSLNTANSMFTRVTLSTP
ncbi:BspA family leucine-rich repeat surface protein, partial [Thalassobellus citreus]|uniref:BspA family leucine-rich repeat surface protein n=1 Tax=Thalassobellus citreus TaxID=3367752 RepID=UPI0037B4FA42